MRDLTQVSCIAGRFFTIEPLSKPLSQSEGYWGDPGDLTSESLSPASGTQYLLLLSEHPATLEGFQHLSEPQFSPPSPWENNLQLHRAGGRVNRGRASAHRALSYHHCVTAHLFWGSPWTIWWPRPLPRLPSPQLQAGMECARIIRTEATGPPVLEAVTLLVGKRCSCGQLRREGRGQGGGQLGWSQTGPGRHCCFLSPQAAVAGAGGRKS